MRTYHNTPPTIINPLNNTLAYLVELEKRENFYQKINCTVTQWLIYAPWAHNLWHSYLLSVVHLRDVEGCSKPVKKFPEATHEVSLLALHPDYLVDIDNPAKHFLNPPNYLGQVKATDIEVMAMASTAACDIVKGILSPDTDFRSQWKERFGNHYYV